jgi:tRNA pseudouridine-54 N-methylase
VGLFISGDLRRDVIVSLAVGVEEDLRIISFPGHSLRRVSPDERSISFFLLKAFEKSQALDVGETFAMDNGIEVTRSPLEQLLKLWGSEAIRVPSKSPERFILDANLSADRKEFNP